ncbi:type II toxin-antitoxin system prevent-host-death family antitoxin [Leptospira bandrabouensis]|uniref:type II toxin-antitoxin system Phd/YefM family antitoxin n=1 Tax=Leptospira bandrabouensis TaxID=2484903 RepID=UPI00223D022F|nr:type II toxin-antitoxin system prevent-host-death family antitoxin [Leptospira bandrabouensis]MCW7478347.1 type II toxin-antitoxin system prevent-host-death family antitoxin [Leptospira bandrabouensis]MCW7485531.1 type II toxin-antitoxin system prevent-host-death family antitoxin [Leptospira bandrabouensis]
MKSVGIKDLKNNLSNYLDFVRNGETIIVMDRNTPIAELKKLSKSPNLTQAFIDESVANNSIIPAKERSIITFPKSLRLKNNHKEEISKSWKQAYLEDRE